MVITGANGGIGYYTALELGKRGATVVCLCRDAERGKKALEDLFRAYPQGNFELEQCDVSSLQSVRAFAGLQAARIL